MIPNKLESRTAVPAAIAPSPHQLSPWAPASPAPGLHTDPTALPINKRPLLTGQDRSPAWEPRTHPSPPSALSLGVGAPSLGDPPPTWLPPPIMAALLILPFRALPVSSESPTYSPPLQLCPTGVTVSFTPLALPPCIHHLCL